MEILGSEIIFHVCLGIYIEMREHLVNRPLSLVTRLFFFLISSLERCISSFIIGIQIAMTEESTRVRGDARIKTREECEFILLIGLPGAGISHNVSTKTCRKEKKISSVRLFIWQIFCVNINFVMISWLQENQPGRESMRPPIRRRSSRSSTRPSTSTRPPSTESPGRTTPR